MAETPTASVHRLKTWPVHFAAIWANKKTAELRKDDRGFEAGDTLMLEEFEPTTQAYTGRLIEAKVTHIIRSSFGLRDGFAMLSIRIVSRETSPSRAG